MAEETFFGVSPLIYNCINSWRSSRFRACYQSHLSITQFNWLRTEEKKQRHGNRFTARDRSRYFRRERSHDRNTSAVRSLDLCKLSLSFPILTNARKIPTSAISMLIATITREDTTALVIRDITEMERIVTNQVRWQASSIFDLEGL